MIWLGDHKVSPICTFTHMYVLYVCVWHVSDPPPLLPPDPVIGQLQRVVVGIVVPSVCMCMLVVIGYLLYHYLMGKGQKTPYILVMQTHKVFYIH